MKITETIVNDVNNALENINSGIRFIFAGSVVAPMMKLTIADSEGFIDNSISPPIVNTTDKFYEWLENYMNEHYGITLDYNNTKNICWSNDYFCAE